MKDTYVVTCEIGGAAADAVEEGLRQRKRADELEDRLSYAVQEIKELKAKLYDAEHAGDHGLPQAVTDTIRRLEDIAAKGAKNPDEAPYVAFAQLSVDVHAAAANWARLNAIGRRTTG